MRYTSLFSTSEELRDGEPRKSPMPSAKSIAISIEITAPTTEYIAGDMTSETKLLISAGPSTIPLGTMEAKPDDMEDGERSVAKPLVHVDNDVDELHMLEKVGRLPIARVKLSNAGRTMKNPTNIPRNAPPAGLVHGIVRRITPANKNIGNSAYIINVKIATPIISMIKSHAMSIIIPTTLVISDIPAKGENTMPK
ncbi:MAG: hypothetical protein QXR58_02900 [Candidatus Micrarchaeaceae archaeon]